MKRVKEYANGFDINEELTIYSRIGEEKSPYQNYCEWHGYVCKKYGGGKYAESTLKNFVHYLKREKNIVVGNKEIWSGCTIPILTVFIAIIYTLVFSVINVINTYNSAISTMVNDEFMYYSGYNAEIIYEALEENLYSGMKFYAFGAIIMSLAVLQFLYTVSFKIRDNNLKKELYSDYITIVQEIIEEQKSGKAETA